VSSLYTNVPLKETIGICLDKLFANDNSILGFSRTDFKKLLDLVLTDTNFLFNNNLYKQLDGLSMGNPVAPAMANIFMCHLEEQYLAQCDSNFKPLFYRRYLDDTFVIFRKPEHADKFLNLINSCHPSIKFTMDTEEEGSLPFLDVRINRAEIGTGNTITTSFSSDIFRKATFTGLGTSFFSFCPFKYKINAIKTLIHRAYKLTSNFTLFHNELEFLRNYFANNGYPKFHIESIIKKHLNSIYQPNPKQTTVPKNIIYVIFPYYGEISLKLERSLNNIIGKYFPQIEIIVAFSNSSKISSMFKIKDFTS
jgi:hypothetical protein